MGRSPEFGRIENTKIEKPWGYELRWAITDRYAAKVLHINKGEALSLQYHERKDEYQYVIKGSIDIEVGGPGGVRSTGGRTAGNTFHLVPSISTRLPAV